MSGVAIEERSIDLATGALRFLDAGAGEAVVLLHGIGAAARSFRAQLQGLAPDRRVLAWNAPGYAGSAHFADEWPDVGAYAQVVAAWLDALSVGPFHLVGHSLGSLIAARVAADHPSRVKTLTLASCAIGHARLDEATRNRLLRSRIEDIEALGARGMAQKRGPRLMGPDASPQATAAVIDVMASVDPNGYCQAARMLSRGDMLADLARTPLSTPAQVVYGAADAITPPEVNRRAAAARGDIAVATIERAGHALYVEQPERFNAIVRTFIEARR